MTEPDEQGRRRRPDVFAVQLRQFDGKVSDLRGLYDSLTAEERSQFRAWLERVEALVGQGYQWSALLRVRTEYDVCDENGKTLRWADTEFSPRTMLAAIKAWDAGEHFGPPGVPP